MRRMCLLAVIITLPGCNLLKSAGPNSTTTTANYDTARVLAETSAQVVAPAFAAAASEAALLADAVSAWASAAAAGPATTQAETARQAFKRTMEAWQRVEVMHLGPSAPAESDPAGESLRDPIYAWPSVNPCRIDQMLVGKTYESPTFGSDQLVNVQGLAALEYLLHYAKTENQCPAQATINSSGQWAALGIDEIARRRTAYAMVLATDVQKRTQALSDLWNGKSPFGRTLSHAGQSGSPYPSQQAAMDALFRAIFALDLMTKDARLGAALGTGTGCSTAPCPDLLELPWSGLSREAILMNVQGFRDLFTAGEGYGLEDALRSLDHGKLADHILADIDALLPQLSESTPLDVLLEQDLTSAQRIYDALKTLTDTLKSDMIVALGLNVPKEGAGDTD